MTDKPPYRVPTLAEVKALPDNGLRVASLFAGGGGSSLGYRMAGFRVLYANEFVDAAADTYQANADPTTVVDRRDIRTITGQDILDATNLRPGELDVLDGSPPCASFSTAGRRAAKWGQVSDYSETRQRTDDLFYEYARIVEEVQPRSFVAENVSGLVKGVSKGYFRAILARLRAAGYRVDARLLDASRLGVPQRRQRLIFVGTRLDLDTPPAHPAPLPYIYTLADALPHLLAQGAGADGGFGSGAARWRSPTEPSGTIGAHPKTGNGWLPTSIIVAQKSGIGSGQQDEWLLRDRSGKPSPTIGANGINGMHSKEWVIVDRAKQPAPTVMAHGIRGVGPHQWVLAGRDLDTCPETGKDLVITDSVAIGRHFPDLPMRQLSIPEVRLLCSVPADYELTGTYKQRWERMGRSVPPLMMAAIAATVRDRVLCAG